MKRKMIKKLFDKFKKKEEPEYLMKDVLERHSKYSALPIGKYSYPTASGSSCQLDINTYYQDLSDEEIENYLSTFVDATNYKVTYRPPEATNKVKCKYCGQMNYNHDLQCRGCGAGL